MGENPQSVHKPDERLADRHNPVHPGTCAGLRTMRRQNPDSIPTPAAMSAHNIQLKKGLSQLGIDVQPEQTEQLAAYLAQMRKWNRAYNLTAIRDPLQMVIRHVLDSAAVLPAMQTLTLERPRLLDVGAGAGLPGIPLAILWPQLQVTCVDSIGKKALFMRHIQRTFGLQNLSVIEGRVEELEAEEPWPLVTSRAFAALSDFIRLTMPLLSDAGRWFAMKGRIDPGELNALPSEVRIEQTLSLQVPGMDEERHLLILTRDNRGD